MEIRKLTATGRPMDFSYLTNKLIMLIVAVVFVGATAYQLFKPIPFFEALGWGFGVSVTIFLTWAINRELDPDQPYSAFVSAGLALLFVPYYYAPSFLVLFWLLTAMRLVNRTTGIPAYTGDSLIVLVLTSLLIFLKNSWIAGIGGVLFFLLDASLPRGNKRQYVFTLIQGAVLVAGIFLVNFETTFHLPENEIMVGLLGLALLAIPWILSYRKVVSVCDDTVDLLEPKRMQWMQVLVFVLLSMLLISNGEQALRATLPVWLCFTGAILFKYLKALVSVFGIK